MHEFRFSGSSTIRTIGLEPGTSKEQGELVTASTMWPAAHHTVCEAVRSSSIGSRFFSSLCAGFVSYMLIGTKVYIYIYKTIMFRVYLNKMSVTMATVIAPYMTYSIIYSRSHFRLSSRFSAGAGVGGSGRAVQFCCCRASY